MRSISAACLIALCLSCSDSGDLTGVDKRNLSIRIDVTGEVSLAPATFRLSLDGLNWRTETAGEEHLLLVPPGDHTVSLTPFDNIIDLGWCLQLEPSSIGARFKQNSMLYARFNVYCPSATGTGNLTVLVRTQGAYPSTAFSVVLTRIVGIAGSQTISVPPGSSIQAVLTAGLYRVTLANAGFCKLVPTNSAGIPAVAVRNGESSALTLTVSCLPPFIFPPGVP